jgi:hypothetical protein
MIHAVVAAEVYGGLQRNITLAVNIGTSTQSQAKSCSLQLDYIILLRTAA